MGGKQAVTGLDSGVDMGVVYIGVAAGGVDLLVVAGHLYRGK